jgi:hypothetical protein
MNLAGTRLGPYDILALLGAGGMGEVYRARDARLNRDVAIKVLPATFLADRDRLARFKREAQVLASLNHPNIASIYGFEDSQERPALVLELVDGPTLAERLRAGPLPLGEALSIARQLCLALESAHESGVVHRDLKPANITVRPDGTVKVLDFGLAKALERPGASAAASSPTVTSPALTGVGVVVGTAAYMSPEQAKGAPADARSDIWAFGAVLYEMLTARPAFRGESVSEVLSAILRDEPDWKALPAATPDRVSWILRRCLTKDRSERLCHIGDARWELDHPLDAPPARARRDPKVWLGWGAAAVLAIVAATGWLRTRPNAPDTANVVLTIAPPAGTALAPVGSLASSPEIAPDGSGVLYFTPNGLYLRRLDSLDSIRVVEAGAVTNAFFWSADSTSVVYPATNAQLIRVRLPNGAPEVLAALPVGSRGGSWSDDGSILVGGGALRLVSAGGQVKELAAPGLRQGIYMYPEFLPGREDFLFLFAPAGNEEREVYLARLRDGVISDPVLLLKNETAVRYTPAAGGRVLFVRNDNLYSQRLNRTTRALEGEPELLRTGVASQPGAQIYRADFSVARTGAIAYRAGKAALADITVFDRSGQRVGSLGRPGSLQSLVIAPDGTQLLAYGSERASVLDVNHQTGVSLPHSTVRWFAWSVDSLKVIGAENQRRLVERPVTGPGDPREIGTSSLPFGLGQDVSPDGKTLLTSLLGGAGILAINLQRATAGQPPTRLTETGQFAIGPRFAPDGKWIVYEGGDRGSSALFVQPYPGPGRRRQIASGGRYPEWRRDGKEILFCSLRSDEIMSVPVTMSGGELQFGTPRPLFGGLRMPAGTTLMTRPLAISRDGSRIFFPQEVEQPASGVIHLSTQWSPR